MSSVAEKCERLVAAYEAKGIAVRENLRPGLTAEEIRRIVSPIKIALPPEVLELYSWRNGHLDEEADAAIRFRDNTFISLERAVEEYGVLSDAFGWTALDSDRIAIATCIPISTFEGAWNVVACGRHGFGANLKHPVISVSEGIDLFFHSISTMLETCVSWVSHPRWDESGLAAAEAEEMRIWKLHNPGIFESAG